MAASDSLNARKRRFVAAMFAESTILDAARVAGVSERTAHRYLKGDPDVRRALSEALDDLLAGVTRQVAGEMTGAVRTLAAVHSDGTMPAAARVAAARALLGSGVTLRDAVDLTERVAALEAQKE